MIIKILDIGISNIQSVINAFTKIEKKVAICKNSHDFSNADAYVLPGVGSFDVAMNNILSRNLQDAIHSEIIIKKKVLLGICLGMQLFFTTGYENNKKTKGLNLISGDVKKLDLPDTNVHEFKLPHVGWNDVNIKNSKGIYTDIDQHTDFYFIHSYYVMPKDKKIISSTTNNGVEFTSAIEFENIYGVQFHPEKSQKAGLKLLKNWCNLIG